MKPIIIFDFGGVLMDWDPRYLYRKVFNGDEQRMERFLSEVDFYAWNLHQDRGRSFEEGVRAACAEHPEYCAELQLYRERWIESVGGAIDGTVEILHALKARGYRLYALTNWAAETFMITREKFEFFKLFDEIIVSGAVGMAKPEPEIFALTLEKINENGSHAYSIHAEDCLLIDDSPANIGAARALGFQTIAFESPAQLRRVLVQMGVLDGGAYFGG